MLPFRNRTEAGRVLARDVGKAVHDESPIVLALPRGGVPVGFEVAEALNSEFDVFVVRKIGAPGREELAIGAIASGNVSVLNEDVVRALPNPQAMIDMVMAQERLELARRETLYRQDHPSPSLRGRIVILVDDGLATGATMRAAAAALRKQEAAKIIVAVPVGAPETCQELASEVDETVCAIMPAVFHGVGQFYEDFSQTSDEEVRESLAMAKDWEKPSQ